MSMEIQTASGKSKCRGRDPHCQFQRKRIPKGTKTLEISIYGAGGGTTSWFCEMCMMIELEEAKIICQQVGII